MSWLLSLIPGGKILSGAWSIITSRPGLVVIAFLAGWWKGYVTADHSAEMASLRSQNAALKIDLTVAQNLQTLAEAQNDDLEALSADDKKKIDDLLADLQKRSRGECALNGADVKRLRNIK